MSERTKLFPDEQSQPQSSPSRESGPLYHDSSQTPTQRYLQIAFVTVVTICVLVSIIISIYQCATQPRGGLYFLLGLSLVGFVVVEIFMIIFVRKGDLPPQKVWFLYFVGGCVILESIFTDVLMTQ